VKYVVDQPEMNVKDMLVEAKGTDNVYEESTEDDPENKDDDGDNVYQDPPVDPQPVSKHTETEARVADVADDIDIDEKEKHDMYAKLSNLRGRLDSKEHEMSKRIKELGEENGQLRSRLFFFYTKQRSK